MFSFFGSKSKIVKKYPKPKTDRIVEPFAGSARYSLEHWEKDVVLFDKDPVIFGVWKYLLQASKQDILSLPDVPNQTQLNLIYGFEQLSKEEKWLIGFCCNGGSAQPKNVSGKHNFNSWNKDKIRISNNLHKISHWKIFEMSYENIDIESLGVATFFIDPPYEAKGKWYKENKINYPHLRNWINGLNGQIIVCENVGNTWINVRKLVEIPFTHFKNQDDYKKKTVEGIYYDERGI